MTSTSTTATPTARKQVLVAAVGNLWLRDDGFGERGRRSACSDA